MRWIAQNELDKNHWDDLVSENHALIFDYSWYLDALADDWGVLFVDEHKSKGIAVAFTQKLNQKSVYPPFFHRSSTWVGNWSEREQQEALTFLKSRFKGGNFAVETNKWALTNFVYQQIEPSPYFRKSYHAQALRMLKKAEVNDLKLDHRFDKKSFIQLLIKELSPKDDVWSSNIVGRFEQLIDSIIKKNCFHFIEIQHNDQSSGGLIIMKTEQRHIYLKGACSQEVKNLGGMYLAMDKAIEDAMLNNVPFDFGGSRIEGVARFNHNLGGRDVTYTPILWDEYPLWYKTIKKMRHSWKKQKK